MQYGELQENQIRRYKHDKLVWSPVAVANNGRSVLLKSRHDNGKVWEPASGDYTIKN